MRVFVFLKLVFLLSVCSSAVMAETYICSYLYNNEPKSFTAKRISSNKFENISVGGVFYPDIVYEDNQYLILGEPRNYGSYNGYMVSFIDKSSRSFQAYAVSEPNHKDKQSALINGSCLVNESF